METNILNMMESRSLVNNNSRYIMEASNEKHLKMELLDIEDFVKKNDVEEITDPIFFIKDGVPSPKGLLSNEIFGITKEERSNIFGYIDLGDWFITPLAYKTWSSMDSRISNIVHGTKKYIVNDQGELEESENGKCGVKFLKDNFNKIKIKSSDSRKRDVKIQFLQYAGTSIFIKKYLVIPPFYRDVNTNNGGNIGVGDLNKLYSSLLVSVKSLKETQEYGLSLSDSVKGRVQEILLRIYNQLCGVSTESGTALSHKQGIIKRSVMSKTSDYGSRLVLSAPDLKVESIDDLMVDLEYSALPLASAITNFYPFIIFNIKRFFENEFGNLSNYPFVTKDGKISYIKVKDPLSTFSDDAIKKQLNRFIYGYSNRFSPVEVPVEDENGNTKIFYLQFKGRDISPENFNKTNNPGKASITERRLTWCDIFYIAACESVKNRTMLITRYPIDSCYNQFPTKIRISSTKETEQMYIGNEYYPFYPKIREKDIGKNTSNKFIDTLNICNLYLKAIVGDYDGDQVGIKAVYTDEANDELIKFIDSKANYIDFGGINIRQSSNEAVQSIYSLTKVLPETKLTNPTF